MIKTLASGLAWAIAVSSTAAADFGREGVLRQLQFSADGKHVLAQDNSHITVLTVDPLRVLFRVQADQAVLGRFTPDSREIVFVRSMPRVVEGQMPPAQGTPRVERWRLANCTRVASTAIPVLMCGTALLGPDGRTLACADLKGRLHVVDVQAGCEAFTKKEFALGSEQLYLWAADFEFSPDGRFLIVRPEVDGVAVVWDAGEKQLVKARGRIKLLSKHMSREEISPYMRAYVNASLSWDRTASRLCGHDGHRGGRAGDVPPTLWHSRLAIWYRRSSYQTARPPVRSRRAGRKSRSASQRTRIS